MSSQQRNSEHAKKQTTPESNGEAKERMWDKCARGRFYTSACHVDLFWIRTLKPPAVGYWVWRNVFQFPVCSVCPYHTIIARLTQTTIADFWLSLLPWTWVIWWIYWSLQWMTWMSTVTHPRSSLSHAALIKRIVLTGKVVALKNRTSF